jgi:hypothetical protein
MSDFLTAAQEAIFDEINGAIDADVFDDVPFLPEGKPDEDFPYVVIGNDTAAPFDTDDIVGANITVTLHFWSRSSGMKEVKALMGDVYDLLNRSKLAASSAVVVDCLYEFGETMVDPDGRTRHGVQRYRLTMQEC